MKRSLGIVLAALVVVFGAALPSQAAHVRGSVYIGPGWWGPGWWGPPYGYYGYPYPYYAAPPVVIRQEPQEYVHQPAPQPEQQYWYYCSESKAYYPYVKKCPGGWMKVVPTPQPAPPDGPQEEE